MIPRLTTGLLGKIPNKTRFGILGWLSLFVSTAVLPTTCWGHEFEDGFVERSVVFYAQDNYLIVEYSVGLNPNSMRDILRTTESTGTKATPELPVIEFEARAAGSDSKPPKTTKKDFPSGREKTSIQAKPTATKREKKLADAGKNDEAKIELTEEEKKIERQFAELIDKKIKAELGIQLDGQPLDLDIISTEKSPRHHVNVTVTLKSKQLKPGPHKLLAVDTNFLQLDGGVRYAMKCRGGSVLKSSNVAPSLIRAERTELGKIRMDARKKYTTVISQFVIPE